METIRLSNRLQAVASWITPCGTVADVGTDHGYLPVWLLQTHTAQRVIASDIHAGPLDRARRSAAEYSLENAIRFELCDGLQFAGADAADTVVIAGMGGETIITILDAAPWTRNGRRLVLQPQSKIRELTDWLQDNGYMLADAQLCLDTGKLYLILDVRGAASQERMMAEMLLLRRRDPLLPQYLAEQDARLRRAIAGMERAERQEVAAELRRAKQVLEEIARYEEVVKAW
ncbi:MAG: class I SAM-dependent methyltransferase [Oscillospiraceae bacterium]